MRCRSLSVHRRGSGDKLLPLFQLSACNCRRATGGAVAAFADLAPGQFDWVSGEPMFYASSPGVRRGFCNACGTSLTYESDDQDGGVHVLSATLDLPGTHQPLAVFCKNERLPWLDVVLPST